MRTLARTRAPAITGAKLHPNRLLRKNRNTIACGDCYTTAALRCGAAFADNEANGIIAIGCKRAIAPETYS